MDRNLLLTALRVLGRMASELKIAPADVDTLRRCASRGEDQLPIDELCYQVLKRELGPDPRRREPA